MDREILFYLDDSGCKYGRETREMLLKCQREANIHDVALREKVQIFTVNHQELWDAIEKLSQEITALKVKLAWFLGAASMVGSILGSVLTFLLQRLAHG